MIAIVIPIAEMPTKELWRRMLVRLSGLAKFGTNARPTSHRAARTKTMPNRVHSRPLSNRLVESIVVVIRSSSRSAAGWRAS